ncbi:MAG: hypothetical protein DRN68_09745 [Thaumarchaeota archaeon]|nr:MAG: hypothetical protein DRN68_09745 [Nitrososphaerota archaeon]
MRVTASPAMGDVDNDGRLEVIVDLGGWDSPDVVCAINGEDGSILWQNTEDVSSDFGVTPVLGDVNGDGEIEAVFYSSLTGYLYVLSASNGTLLNKKYVRKAWFNSEYGGLSLGDINGDGDMEIFLLISDYWEDLSMVYTFEGSDLSVLWVFTMDEDRRNHMDLNTRLAVSDIDGDGLLEVVAFTADYYIYAINAEDGSLLWRIDLAEIAAPKEIYRENSTITESTDVIVGDFNFDGIKEVITATTDNFNLYVLCLSGLNGSLLWYRILPDIKAVTGMAVADLDNDGLFEVVLATWTNWYCVLNLEDGSLLWYNYIGRDYGRYILTSTPSIGDVDGDEYLEIIINPFVIDEKNGSILAFLGYYTTWTSAVVADVDGDGKIEVIAMGGNESGNYLYCFDFPDAGFRVYWEAASGDFSFHRTNSLEFVDPDMDFLSTYTENVVGTNPYSSDTDRDGFSDYEELLVYHTDPNTYNLRWYHYALFVLIGLVPTVLIIIKRRRKGI